MTNSFLKNNFYTIKSTNVLEDQTLVATILLNKEHAIFKGHFEQMPVVPGVCQTQIIKEVLQDHIQKNLTLTKGDNIKFMTMIIPTTNEIITLHINFKEENSVIIVDAKISDETSTFTKFKGAFTIN